MNEQVLIEKLLAQRRKWVEVAPGKKVQFRRPDETELPDLIDGGKVVVDVRHVRKYVVGWSGITEADLLGEALGACDEVAFTPALWDVVVSDRIDWVTTVARGIIDALNQHHFSIQVAEKNSAPSST